MDDMSDVGRLFIAFCAIGVIECAIVIAYIVWKHDREKERNRSDKRIYLGWIRNRNKKGI